MLLYSVNPRIKLLIQREFRGDHLAESEAVALTVLLEALRISSAELRENRQAQLRVLDEISKLLRQQAMTPDRKRQAVERLSDRGLLPLANYVVDFAKDWEAFEVLFKERKESIKEVVASAAFRHLMPSNRGVDFPAVSLLAKRILPQRAQPFVMLVVAERLPSTLRVYSAWRVPMHFVPPTADPWNLLEHFVDKFGLFLRIPNRPARQLIHYDTIASSEGGSPFVYYPAQTDKSFRFPFAPQIDEPAIPTAIFRVRQVGQLEVSIAFAISLARYQESLRSLKG